MLIGLPRAIFHNPEEFSEPEEFQPERFLNRTPEGGWQLNKSVRDPMTIAFGFGRRLISQQSLSIGH
jgi:cytochrome P450